MVTTYDLDELVYRALDAGAAGFLLKSTPADRIAQGVESVAAGESLLSPSVTRRLIEQYVSRPAPGGAAPPLLDGLADRECDVLELVAHGRSNAEIADMLVVSLPTIKTHVNRIFAMLHLENRVQAVVLAYECGLVVPGDTTGGHSGAG